MLIYCGRVLWGRLAVRATLLWTSRCSKSREESMLLNRRELAQEENPAIKWCVICKKPSFMIFNDLYVVASFGFTSGARRHGDKITPIIVWSLLEDVRFFRNGTLSMATPCNVRSIESGTSSSAISKIGVNQTSAIGKYKVRLPCASIELLNQDVHKKELNRLKCSAHRDVVCIILQITCYALKIPLVCLIQCE